MRKLIVPLALALASLACSLNALPTATPLPTRNATPTAEQTSTPMPPQPQETPDPTAQAALTAHQERVLSYEPIFATQGIEIWMLTAGIDYASLDIKNATVLVDSGRHPYGIRPNPNNPVPIIGLNAKWPAAIRLLDKPQGGTGDCIRIDVGVFCTNMVGFIGNAEIFIDLQNLFPVDPGAMGPLPNATFSPR